MSGGWRVERAELFSDIWICVISDSRRWLMARIERGSKEQAEADAARIVACVNFCAGLSNEELQPPHDIHHPLIVGSGPLDEIDWQQRAISAEIKVRSLEKELEEAKALVASYDRQDDLIGTEFEGVDEVTDVIRLLKDERDLLKQSLESSRAEYEKLKPFLTHHFECPTNSAHTVGQKPFLCTCGLDTLLSTLTKEEKK